MTNTGGPAFPFKCQGSTTAPEVYYGMTLRDYFAAKAMQAHMQREAVFVAISEDRLTPEKVCSVCYAWADKMLEAREQ